MEQSAINARLDKLESSVDGIARVLNFLTKSLHSVLFPQECSQSDNVVHEECLVNRSTQEQEAKYTIVKVARDEDLTQQIGRDTYFDLVDFGKVKGFRVKKLMLFNHFKDKVAKEFGIPVQFLRFWLLEWRTNESSYRPLRPLTVFDEIKTVSQVRGTTKQTNNNELDLFLEVELGLDLCPITPPEKTSDDILLFFKLYDPVKEELRYVGRLFVKGFGKPAEILMKLNEMAGYGCEEEILLYEEVKFKPMVMCVPIHDKITFTENELEDGDIICFQKAIRLPDVPSYLTHLHKRQIASQKALAHVLQNQLMYRHCNGKNGDEFLASQFL